MSNFKLIWGKMGDQISMHYTGTGSTHTDVTIKGKRDMSGLLGHGMVTLSRLYNQVYVDNER